MFQTITLKGGAEVIVDINDKGKCKSCKMPIVWAVSKTTGRYMPICKDTDGLWISHHANCPQAEAFRRKKTIGAGDMLDECDRQAARDKW